MEQEGKEATHTHQEHPDKPLLEPRSRRFDELVFQSEELTAILHRAYDNLNFFNAASVVQPNSSQYHGHVMNYQFREPVAGDSFLGV
ncbi:hypothetical protein Ahy_B02g060397 [Arachis hypogaea]|uniref:Uncharacterized protein n=1 Tax=Arachis hypogaea TaxID=3818 RepID=A0A445AIE2_ARAHY|nr:hypothetical protein Ahy_B02g060397 [Arachis hypogaea]